MKQSTIHFDRARDLWEHAKKEGITAESIPTLIELIDSLFKLHGMKDENHDTNLSAPVS